MFGVGVYFSALELLRNMKIGIQLHLTLINKIENIALIVFPGIYGFVTCMASPWWEYGGSMHTSQVQSIIESRNSVSYSHMNTIFEYCPASVGFR